MKNFRRTVFLICSLSVLCPQLLSASETKENNSGLDSTEINEYRDSLIERERSRVEVFEYAGTNFYRQNPFHIPSPAIFSSDAKSPSELLGTHPLFSSVRFGISSSLNRFLPYGNVAPINTIRQGYLFSNTTGSLMSGTDLVSANEISDIFLENGGNLSYRRTGLLTVPEATLLWENGVFDENILQVRFSRPLSKHLLISAFSNFRHFDGKSYSHDGNDVYFTYSRVTDTSHLSHKGYNPLTNEHTVGASLAWSPDKRQNTILDFYYGDLSNEIALDKDKPRDQLEHALIHRYPLRLQLRTSRDLPGDWFIDAEGRYENEPVTRITAGDVNGRVVPVRNDASRDEKGLALRSGLKLASNDTAGIALEVRRNSDDLFNGSKVLSLKSRPELFYRHSFDLKSMEGTIGAGAGAIFHDMEGRLSVRPFWNAGIDLSSENSEIRGYVKQDNIPYTVPYDSFAENQARLDLYYNAGVEYFRRWEKLDLLLGYQFVYGVSDSNVNASWINGQAPYRQPRSVLVIAPGLGEWNGLSLRTSAMISDCKPYLKTSTALSYTVHPVSTREYIRALLSFDYWSEREPVMFAGYSDWNVPICNLNVELSAHIRSFRLFYKIDNLLNRRFAYIPGYYSPGLTFRWGFNWFIQR